MCTNCPPPYNLYSDKCLLANYIGPADFYGSQSLCHQLKGDLVKIQTADHLEAIINMIKAEGK